MGQLRVGTVSSVNIARRTARVIFGDKADMVSGELVVLRNSPLIVPRIKTSDEKWEKRQTYNGTNSSEDRSILNDYTYFDKIHAELKERQHSVDISTFSWLPYIGQTVLCAFIEQGDGDGYIIGGV